MAGVVDHGARDPMGAEDGDAAGRHVGYFLDEAHALGSEPLDDVAVVHDLMADIDGGAEFLERALHDRDRALDPGTKPPRLGQDHPHPVPPPPPESRAADYVPNRALLPERWADRLG